MLLPDFTTGEIAAMLRDMRPVQCTSSYAQGCRCPEHGGAGVPRAVSTPVLKLVCDGSMMCRCDDCSKDRAHLVRIGSRDRRQPWAAARAA